MQPAAPVTREVTSRRAWWASGRLLHPSSSSQAPARLVRHQGLQPYPTAGQLSHHGGGGRASHSAVRTLCRDPEPGPLRAVGAKRPVKPWRQEARLGVERAMARSSGGATRTGESCGWTHLTGKRSGAGAQVWWGGGVLRTPPSRSGTFLGWRRPCRGGEAQPPSPTEKWKDLLFYPLAKLSPAREIPHASHQRLPLDPFLLPVGLAHP